MRGYFKNPVIKNPTRPTVGDAAPFCNAAKLNSRVGGNTGNMAFLFAIRHQIVGVRHISEMGEKSWDVNVLGCSNQINKNVKKSADDALFAGTDAPFVAIGLGAQAPDVNHDFKMPEGTQEWVAKIQSLAPGDGPNISVRGEYTLKVLRENGLGDRAVALGCPSLYINPARALGAKIRRKLQKNVPCVKVATAPGNIVKMTLEMSDIERSLAAIATDYGGGYICQHPPELFDFARGAMADVSEDTIRSVRDNVRPHLSLDDCATWFRRASRIFVNIPSWLEHLRSVDLVIGTRIHGTMLALQAGTPAVCVTIDSRQVELCEIMNIPSIPRADVERGVSVEHALDVLHAFDWLAFDENRQSLCRRYTSFLESNGLQPSSQLARIGDVLEADALEERISTQTAV